MNCMNCGKAEADKLFAGVLVCADCRAAADELMAKAEVDTRRLLSLLQEGIRVALIEQTFKAAETNGSRDVQMVLRSITTLKESAERRRNGGRGYSCQESGHERRHRGSGYGDDGSSPG